MTVAFAGDWMARAMIVPTVNASGPRLLAWIVTGFVEQNLAMSRCNILKKYICGFLTLCIGEGNL
jgi:hypothetical protein